MESNDQEPADFEQLALSHLDRVEKKTSKKKGKHDAKLAFYRVVKRKLFGQASPELAVQAKQPSRSKIRPLDDNAHADHYFPNKEHVIRTLEPTLRALDKPHKTIDDELIFSTWADDHWFLPAVPDEWMLNHPDNRPSAGTCRRVRARYIGKGRGWWKEPMERLRRDGTLEEMIYEPPQADEFGAYESNDDSEITWVDARVARLCGAELVGCHPGKLIKRLLWPATPGLVIERLVATGTAFIIAEIHGAGGSFYIEGRGSRYRPTHFAAKGVWRVLDAEEARRRVAFHQSGESTYQIPMLQARRVHQLGHVAALLPFGALAAMDMMDGEPGGQIFVTHALLPFLRIHGWHL